MVYTKDTVLYNIQYCFLVSVGRAGAEECQQLQSWTDLTGCCTRWLDVVQDDWMLYNMTGCCTRWLDVVQDDWMLYKMTGCCTRTALCLQWAVLYGGMLNSYNLGQSYVVQELQPGMTIIQGFQCCIQQPDATQAMLVITIGGTVMPCLQCVKCNVAISHFSAQQFWKTLDVCTVTPWNNSYKAFQ